MATVCCSRIDCMHQLNNHFFRLFIHVGSINTGSDTNVVYNRQTSFSWYRLRHLPTLQIATALERILTDVNPTAPAEPVWTAEQQQQEAAFNAANCPVSPAVYYSPVVYQALEVLYSDVQAAISASAPQAADTKKGDGAMY